MHDDTDDSWDPDRIPFYGVRATRLDLWYVGERPSMMIDDGIDAWIDKLVQKEHLRRLHTNLTLELDATKGALTLCPLQYLRVGDIAAWHGPDDSPRMQHYTAWPHLRAFTVGGDMEFVSNYQVATFIARMCQVAHQPLCLSMFGAAHGPPGHTRNLRSWTLRTAVFGTAQATQAFLPCVQHAQRLFAVEPYLGSVGRVTQFVDHVFVKLPFSWSGLRLLYLMQDKQRPAHISLWVPDAAWEEYAGVLTVAALEKVRGALEKSVPFQFVQPNGSEAARSTLLGFVQHKLKLSVALENRLYAIPKNSTWSEEVRKAKEQF